MVAVGEHGVGPGQAEAGQTATYGPIGGSVTAMLGHALLVRTSVPSTFPMLHVASGQNDVFWQYACVLPGVAAGVEYAQSGKKVSGYTDTGVTLIAAKPMAGVDSKDVKTGTDLCWGAK